MSERPDATEETPPSGEMTCAEAGRRGGGVTKERHGRAHYERMGKLGGERLKELYGHEHYAAIGAKGGNSTAARHGHEHYVEGGKRAGARTKALIAEGLRLEAEEKKR